MEKLDKKTIYYLNEVQVALHWGCVKINRSHIPYMSDLTEQKSSANILPITKAMQELHPAAQNNTSDEELGLADLDSTQKRNNDHLVGGSNRPKPVEVSSLFSSM